MLMNSIETAILKIVREYNERICEKYELNVEELEAMWKEVSGSEAPKKKRGPAKKKEDDSTPSTPKQSKAKSKDIEGGCPYVFIKGKNEGNICNSKPKDGATYCSRHAKCEETGQKEKKKIPSAKTVASKNEDKDKKKKDEKPKIVIRMNKDINKYWNPETKLVFKSKEERVVIGNYDNDTLNKLTDDDIAVCEKFGFKYEKEEEKPKSKTKPKEKEEKKNKSLAEEIVKTNMDAKNIENVLKEICDDDEEVNEDEEVNDEEEEEEEGEEEEEVNEEEEILEEDD
jgi:hypothetical protein